MKFSCKSLVIINIVTLAMMLFLNYAFNAGLLSDKNVAAISHKYDTLFAPAGYAFSIWGFIFMLCIGFTVYQGVLLIKNDPQQYIRRTGLWFTIGNIANGLWLYCWTNEMMGLSVALIVVLLTSLCVLIVRLRPTQNEKSMTTNFFVWWPVVIYLGWIMVATIACVAAWLVSMGWRGEVIGETTITITMVIVAALIYLFIIVKHNLTLAGVVGIWAFVAIAVRQQYANNHIDLTALVASGTLTATIISHIYFNYRELPKIGNTPK